MTAGCRARTAAAGEVESHFLAPALMQGMQGVSAEQSISLISFVNLHEDCAESHLDKGPPVF